jgi:truncated hemoglobin YjbI
MLCATRAAQDMDWPQADKDELMQRLREMADHLRNTEQQFGCGHGVSG